MRGPYISISRITLIAARNTYIRTFQLVAKMKKKGWSLVTCLLETAVIGQLCVRATTIVKSSLLGMQSNLVEKLAARTKLVNCVL